VLALVALAGTALVLIATTVLYFTGPTTKTVTHQVWHPRECAGFHSEPDPTPWPGGFSTSTHVVCDGWDAAGYVPESETLRTSAWERIAGAVTGSGHIDS
jgi:hypothetical protein